MRMTMYPPSCEVKLVGSLYFPEELFLFAMGLVELDRGRHEVEVS